MRSVSKSRLQLVAMGLCFAFSAGTTLAQPSKNARANGAKMAISLSEAIDKAIHNSETVVQSEADMQAQIERKRSAWADLGPRVTADYTYVQFEDEQKAQFGPQEIMIRDDKSQLGSITVAQPLTGLAALFEKARFEGAQQDLRENALVLTKTEVAYGTAEAYLRARQADQQYAIAVSSIEAAESQQRDAAALERVGRMNRGDVLKLELAVSETKARAAQARAARDIAFASLRMVLGVPANVTLDLQDDLPPVDLTGFPSSDQAYDVALKERVDLSQANLGVDLAQFGRRFVYAEFSPNVNAFVKWERNFGEVSGLGGGEKDTRTYGVQLSWNLWNNGSHVFKVREASAQVEKAEAMAQSVNEQIRLDVFQAYANLGAAQESVDLAKVAVTQAEEAYRIEKARFSTGTRSATDLVLAETSQAGARGRLVSAQTDYVVWYLKLQKTLGYDKPKI